MKIQTRFALPVALAVILGLSAVIPISESVMAAPQFESTEIPVSARGAIAGDTRGDGQNRIVIGSANTGYVSIYTWQGGTYVKEWEDQVLVWCNRYFVSYEYH